MQKLQTLLTADIVDSFVRLTRMTPVRISSVCSASSFKTPPEGVGLDCCARRVSPPSYFKLDGDAPYFRQNLNSQGWQMHQIATGQKQRKFRRCELFVVASMSSGTIASWILATKEDANQEEDLDWENTVETTVETTQSVR